MSQFFSERPVQVVRAEALHSFIRETRRAQLKEAIIFPFDVMGGVVICLFGKALLEIFKLPSFYRELWNDQKGDFIFLAWKKELAEKAKLQRIVFPIVSLIDAVLRLTYVAVVPLLVAVVCTALPFLTVGLVNFGYETGFREGWQELKKEWTLPAKERWPIFFKEWFFLYKRRHLASPLSLTTSDSLALK